MKRILLASAILLSVSPAAMADGWTVGWSGEASLSGSKTTGNTDTTDIGGALHLEKAGTVWKHKFDTTYDLGSSSGVDNKNRWTVGYQLDRQLNDRLYVYGNANYFTDDFGPFKNGTFIGAGLGFEVLQSDAAKWAVETGAGYRSQKTRTVGNIFPTRQNEFAVRGGSRFSYQFNESVSFFNNSEVIWSDSDTYLWNDAGITAQVAGNLSTRFNFRVDYHSDVPTGIKNTDTITRIALVYTIK